MFEKDAEVYYNGQYDAWLEGEDSFALEEEIEQAFKDGAEFGYNKANEWHDIKEIEPSKEQLGKQLLIKIESVTGDTDYDYFVYKYKGESISDVIGVIAWKEIVLPKESK